MRSPDHENWLRIERNFDNFDHDFSHFWWYEAQINKVLSEASIDLYFSKYRKIEEWKILHQKWSLNFSWYEAVLKNRNEFYSEDAVGTRIKYIRIHDILIQESYQWKWIWSQLWNCIETTGIKNGYDLILWSIRWDTKEKTQRIVTYKKRIGYQWNTSNLYKFLSDFRGTK